MQSVGWKYTLDTSDCNMIAYYVFTFDGKISTLETASPFTRNNDEIV